MTLLHTFILSLIEGITEFLPVSSTGHLIVASRLMGISASAFSTSFEILIQLGAMCAVLTRYGKTLLRDALVWQRVAVAFLPTAIVGAALYHLVKDTLLTNLHITVWALGIGGVALLLFEWWHAKRPSDNRLSTITALTWHKAIVVGVFQSLSIIPGVSRAAATIIGGLIMGWDRKTAVEFSFLLAVPTMLAASGYDVLRSGASFSKSEVVLLLFGFTFSFLVAYAVVRWFVRFIQKHTFTPFGIYRILFAIVMWWLLLTQGYTRPFGH
ncbi:MAG: undecaprenyl-diphosphate phosphatase [Patescibacteria group bacterium]